MSSIPVGLVGSVVFFGGTGAVFLASAILAKLDNFDVACHLNLASSGFIVPGFTFVPLSPFVPFPALDIISQ